MGSPTSRTLALGSMPKRSLETSKHVSATHGPRVDPGHPDNSDETICTSMVLYGFPECQYKVTIELWRNLHSKNCRVKNLWSTKHVLLTRHDMRSRATVLPQLPWIHGGPKRGGRSTETIFRDSIALVHLASSGPSQTHTTLAQVYISPIIGICPSFSATSSWFTQIASTQTQTSSLKDLKDVRASLQLEVIAKAHPLQLMDAVLPLPQT